mgnify:CR=1 FL=1|jgi:hypothetical protein
MSTENTPPPARNKHKSISAVDLYNKFIELLTLVPDTKDWQERKRGTDYMFVKNL